MASKGRVVRFFGPRGDLLIADSAGVSVCHASGSLRFRVAIDGVLDAVCVGSELWVAAHDGLTRLAVTDGAILSTERIPQLHAPGWFLQSSTLPTHPVWHGDVPHVISVAPGRAESPPGPASSIAVPVGVGRWLLWEANQLRYWRTGIGEAWRNKVGDPSSEAIDAQLVLEGRLLVLVQRRGPATASAILTLTVAQVSDGAQNIQMRLPTGTRMSIAVRTGVALAWTGEEARLLNLRFGRWTRDLRLPPGVEEAVVDDGLEHIALVFPHSVELTDIASLAVAKRTNGAEARADDTLPKAQITALAIDPAAGAPVAEAEAEPAAPIVEQEPLPDEPLVQLELVSVTPTATADERELALELHLRLIGALANVAIATAWDEGRIVIAASNRPAFSEELGGLLRITRGLCADELAEAYDRLRDVDQQVDAALAAREGRATPLEMLTRDFGLSQLASLMLFATAAPRLRGEFARVYGILTNDPGRPLVDEHLLALLLGEAPQRVASELDADRPLRRHGLIQLGAGTRPFAPLVVEPLVVRTLANLDLDGEFDDVLIARAADRQLDALDLPRDVVISALQYLAAPREGEHARIVLRGRTGSGRHTLLASLAERVGRAIGVIDLNVPRDRTRVAATLEAALRRAKLRGLVPCVDGLELADPDNPDLRQQISTVLRRHPGPLALRLPPEARPPLEPGYLLVDLPARSEVERTASWTAALDRHRIELADASDLAARYRVGPGIIERVCLEVTSRPNRPTDAASWLRSLDDAVRQHLVNRIGGSASRVTHLASWADIVLPEDISDSLLEITSRVRHRKVVFETWGFARSITTARGITALFQGSPGTGKTMVAGAIARDLGLELYRVDVSRITSKWIGETEKNLGALFDAAEEGQVMLLFDEADSLFAKRTEVKSSVDRYANMEVNYLLQRLDSFEGIAILTTNFGNSIDSAFKRRLTYRVTFPFPDEEMREQLWRSLVPPQVPVAGTLNFASLAQRFRLSGGYIRNAALRAAFLAVEEGSALTHEHIERAIRMEFREIGKLAETGALE
ncbi:MAG TPA: ATP-binding protein [Kofleriaceae bacterium]|nr:ATP-binding protein [Kofleriaceae bacterium]